MNEFHTFVVFLRRKQFKSIDKLCKILGIDKKIWRKIERGINPPPRKSVLKKFCNLVYALSYEETQLYELARRWKPHRDTNTSNHLLLDKDTNTEWREVLLNENMPDYEHKYWGKK
tara:strand:+ start:84 stop:431 length:348 start_codon:yes stop_codon:yes gene_type:complete